MDRLPIATSVSRGSRARAWSTGALALMAVLALGRSSRGTRKMSGDLSDPYLDGVAVLLSTCGLMWPWRVTSTSLPHFGQVTDFAVV